MRKLLLGLVILALLGVGCTTTKDKEGNKNITKVAPKIEEKTMEPEAKNKILLNNFGEKIYVNQNDVKDCGDNCLIYIRSNEEFVFYSNNLAEKNTTLYVPKTNKFVWQEFSSPDVELSFLFPIPLGADSYGAYLYETPKNPSQYSLDSGSEYHWGMKDLTGVAYKFAGGISDNYAAGKDWWYTEKYYFSTSTIDKQEKIKIITRRDGLQAYVFDALNPYSQEKDGLTAILNFPSNYSDEFKAISFYFKYPEMTMDDVEKVINSVVFTKK